MQVLPIIRAVTLTLPLSLIACGGGGGGSSSASAASSTSQGTFLDSAVEGISYTCGSQSGTTDSAGRFNFDSGSTCTFKIGGVTLGSAAAKSTLTPVSIVSGATDETNATVIKLAQLLQTLDTDNNPTNGITIAGAVTTALAGSNLTVGSSSDVQALVTQAYSGRTLVTSTNAQNHLRSSILTKMAGTYSCSFSGSDSGSGTVTLTAGSTNGTISGSGTSTNYGGPGTVSGTYSSSGNTSFTLGSVSTGASFSGTLSINGTGSGTWSNSHLSPPESGSWSCSKTS